MTIAAPNLARAQEEIEPENAATDTVGETKALMSELDRQLFTAASGKDKGAIRDLLKRGANIEARDEYGRTPLLVAIQSSPKSSIPKFFIKEGANIGTEDKQGDTAMHYAVRASAGQPPRRLVNGSAVIKALLNAGSPPDRQNDAEQTPRDILLSQSQFSSMLSEYSENESARRSRLGTLEDGLIARGLISSRTYKSQKLTLGNVLAAATSGTIGGGANQVAQRRPNQQPSRTRSSPKAPTARVPIKCAPTTFENLTSAQGSAIVYAINEDNRTRGRRMPQHCIQKIIASSKVPFRGNTLIKYRIYRLYPRGYRTKCLEPVPDQKRNYWDYFEHTSQCNGLTARTSGKPIEVGGVRYEDGETTI